MSRFVNFMNYSKREWLHIFTDGSADPKKKTVGAGYVVVDYKERMFALVRTCNNFKAITRAATDMPTLNAYRLKAAFFIDSHAAIYALNLPEPPENQRLQGQKYTSQEWMESNSPVDFQSLKDC